MHASALQNSGFVINGVITHAAFVVQHPHMWVTDQLIAIAVASNDEHIISGFFAAPSNGGNEIITFKARHIDCVDAKGVEEFANDT